jgi:hypothetical protein
MTTTYKGSDAVKLALVLANHRPAVTHQHEHVRAYESDSSCMTL